MLLNQMNERQCLLQYRVLHLNITSHYFSLRWQPYNIAQIPEPLHHGTQLNTVLTINWNAQRARHV